MSPLPAAPWKEISVDFANQDQEYMLLITDDYSRYPVVDIVKSTSAVTVIPKLDKVFSEFGVQDIVKSDNGPPFSSKEFASFADDLDFKHRKVTPKWARANGEVERLVRTVKKDGHQDSQSGTQEPQAGAEQDFKKLPRHTTQYNENCSSNSTVWKADEDKVTRNGNTLF